MLGSLAAYAAVALVASFVLLVCYYGGKQAGESSNSPARTVRNAVIVCVVAAFMLTAFVPGTSTFADEPHGWSWRGFSLEEFLSTVALFVVPSLIGVSRGLQSGEALEDTGGPIDE